jgi:uncharacterized protein (DUF885 family)
MQVLFEEELDGSPEMVTRLGLDKDARVQAKSRLDDRSLAGLAYRKRLTRQQLRRLRAIDRTGLNGMDAVNYDCLLDDLSHTVEADQRFDYGEKGVGSPYVLSQLNGAYRSIPSFLATQHVIETRADVDAYLARLEDFAEVMDQELERARHDVALGVIPPAFVLDRALGQMRALKTTPARSSLVTSLVERVKAKGLDAGVERAASRIYADQVVPALERQIALLQQLRRRAVDDAGVWRLPDGEGYYKLALRSATTTEAGAEEIHRTGLDQARRLGERADVLLRGQGLTRGTVGERLRALFNDRRQRYPDTDTAKETLIADLNVRVKAMQARLPQAFATLPRAQVEIRRVPKFIEAGAPGGYYTQPSLDGTRPGIYWINLRDTAEAPRWTLPTITYHEAVPGHHLQVSLQQEADLPMIRRVAILSAYVEGWALYAEQLAQEMGIYADDPLGELGYLQAALFRAARLVVDTGLHAKRWSREEAIRTMSSIDGSLQSSATTEVERYCVWPGQATSYMVGKLTWLRLRAKARAVLGAGFDLRQFHDAGLLSGSMPLTVLETVIDGYVAARRA